jgi:hypothetical protein
VEELRASDIVEVYVLGTEQGGGSLGEVKEKVAAAVAAVGDKSDACCVSGGNAHVGRVHAVVTEAREHAVTKGVRGSIFAGAGMATDDADKPGGYAQAGHSVDKDGRRAAGEGSDKLARLGQGLVDVCAHNLDEEFAQGDHLGWHRASLGM